MPTPLSIPARHARCWLLAVWPLTLGLAACSPLASAPVSAPPLTLCDQALRADAASLRLLVNFQQPTVGDAPTVLARLQTEAGACVRYVSSISPTLHAYAVDTMADGDKVGARLLRWSAVKAVQADARAQRH